MVRQALENIHYKWNTNNHDILTIIFKLHANKLKHILMEISQENVEA